MKKFYTLSLLIFSLTTFAQAVDPFLGTGALNANGWTTHSGATPGQLVIIPGSLNYPGITSAGNKTQIVAGNTEDVNVASAAPITGTAYYSAIINVLNTDGLAANADTGNYFLTAGTAAGATVTGFNGRLYIKMGAATGYNLGVLNGSGGTATPSYFPTDLPLNTPTFVVVKFDIATNTASLFINPPVGVAEVPATLTNATGTTAAPAQIASLAIRQGATSAPASNTGNVEIDEVRLGSTWEFVTSSALRNNQNSISGLQVYPNPVTNGNLFITTDNDNSSKSVTVYDVLGKVVVKTTITNQAVNVSNLKGGVYIVKIIEEGKTATRKLVIK